MAKWLSQMVQVGLPINSFNQAAALRRDLRVRGAGRQLARRARADRRRRLHHAVELPAAPDRRQGRPRARRRLHRGAEAERGRAAQRLHPRRDHRRGRPARRRVQPRDRGRPGRRRGDRRRTPTSTWCRSPARPAPASAWPSSAPRRSRRSRWSSAASRANVMLDDLDDADFAKAVADGVGKASSTRARPAPRSPACSCPRERLAEAEAIAAADGAAVHGRRPVRRRRRSSARSSRRPSASACTATSSKGIDEGATLVAGGPDAPEGLEQGFFVQPDGVLRRDAAT